MNLRFWTIVAILGINIIGGLICLGAVIAGRNILGDAAYVDYILTCGLFGLSNYLLIGLPEYIIDRNAHHADLVIETRTIFICMLQILCSTIFLISLYYLMYIFNDRYLSIVLWQIIMFVPQCAVSLMRAHLESKNQQIFSNIIKNSVTSSVYVFPVIMMQYFIMTEVYVIIATFLTIIAIIIYLFVLRKWTIEKYNLEGESYSSIFRRGIAINTIWAQTQFIPFIDKLFSSHLDLPSAARFVFLSELTQRIALIYGTIGQVSFPQFVRSKENVGDFNSLVRKTSIFYLLIIVGIGIIIVAITKFFPALSAKYVGTEQLVLLLIWLSALFTGLYSLRIRPVYVQRGSTVLCCAIIITAAIHFAGLSIFGVSITGIAAVGAFSAALHFIFSYVLINHLMEKYVDR